MTFVSVEPMMRTCDRTGRWVGLAVLVGVTVAGCGPGDDQQVGVEAGVSIASDEVEPADWSLRFTPGPSARELHLLVRERACASGRSSDGRIVADVSENAEAIRLTVGVAALPGDHGCPGNPASPYVVPLSEPVGTRRIEGSGRGIEDGDPATGVELLAREPSALIVPASDADVGMSAWVEPRCETEFTDSSTEEFLPGWESGAEAASEALVASAAAEHYGLPLEGWHVLHVPSPGERGSSWWTQYLDGVAVAQVRVSPGVLGWFGHAAVCAGLGSDFQPDDRPGKLEVDDRSAVAPRLDVDDWLASVPGLRVSDQHWRFDAADRRCETWAAIEDILLDHDATLTFTTQFGRWPGSIDANAGSVRSEVAMGIADGDRGVMLITDEDELVARDINEDLVWDDVSSLTTCQLDQPIAYTVPDR